MTHTQTVTSAIGVGMTQVRGHWKDAGAGYVCLRLTAPCRSSNNTSSTGPPAQPPPPSGGNPGPAPRRRRLPRAYPIHQCIRDVGNETPSRVVRRGARDRAPGAIKCEYVSPLSTDGTRDVGNENAVQRRATRCPRQGPGGGQYNARIFFTKACALGRATGAGPRRARRAAGGDPGGLVVGDDLVLVITRAYHLVVHVAATGHATVARARHALFLAVFLAAR